jgi:hypothetical protein
MKPRTLLEGFIQTNILIVPSRIVLEHIMNYQNLPLVLIFNELQGGA